MLEIKNLTAGYRGKPVLSGLRLTAVPGEILAIVGPNGSGKSTLLKALAGILPSEGEILLHGKNLRQISPSEQAKCIAYLPQNRSVPEITVERFVLHGRFPYLSYPRHYREEDHRIAREAMEQMGISAFARRQMRELSGGERQKAYIAMILAQQTQVVLMDEPTGFLDIAHKFEVIRLARELKEMGKTVILVLHELDLALNGADRIVVLEKGEVRHAGTPEEISQSDVIPRVFHVKMEALETAEGPRYCFAPEMGGIYG